MSKGTSFSTKIAAMPSGSIALRSNVAELTYGELNRKADQLATHLAALGVVKGDAVAICMERSFDQIVAELAAVRACAAFVPIDPALPDERVQHILSDSGAKVFVAPIALSRRIETKATVVDLAVSGAAIWGGAVPGGVNVPAPEDLAYIIYTSGSTGVPKGVEITHGNLEHLIGWHTEAFGVTAADRATHVAGLGFDAAIWEIWPYLSVGASISLASDLTRVDPALLQQWLIDERITISFVPTPVAEPLIARTWPASTSLRMLLTGGDTLHTAPRPGLPFELVNNYGPTECTVVATSGVVSPATEGQPSIGWGIKGTSIYLLDEQQRPVAAGDVGELYIGGGSVGRGYRNLPEQTAKSFLSDPFTKLEGGRMYKSGDRARLLPNGDIAFLGRLDNQEKIRGNRLELDEIVSVLNRHDAVAFNVVVASTDAAVEKYLIAYIMLAEGAAPTAQELREHAANSLPSYMIPSKFVRLTSLPLSTNGKTDRSALPPPSEENLLPEAVSREAASELEQVLLTIVRDLLKTDDIAVDDDFFLVGGHSLLGTQLVLKARETFGVLLTLRDLFEAGTVAALAARIEELILAELNSMSEEEAEKLAADNLA